MLEPSHPLYNVNDVFNAVFVHGNVLGDAMFYGSGAGKLPTASAVVADVVDIAKHLDTNIPMEWSSGKLELADYHKLSCRYFIRTTAPKAEIEAAFGKVTYVTLEDQPDELGVVTEVMDGNAYEQAAQKVSGISQMIRVE